MPEVHPSRLLGDIYDAALDPNGWPVVLDQMAAFLEGNAITLSLHDPAAQWGVSTVNRGIDPAWNKQYTEYYHRVNVHAQNAIGLAAVGVAVGQMFVSDEELLESEYYNDFLKPQDLFHVLGGVVERGDSMLSLVSIYRPERKDAFGLCEEAYLRELVPHLARAARIHRELAASRRDLECAELLGFGLVIIASNRRLVYANSRAREIFAERDGLCLDRSGQIEAVRPVSASLATAVSIAIEISCGRAIQPAADMGIPRPSGRRPYRVSVTPFRAMGPFVSAAVAIFILDPERELSIDPDVLSRAYGLTRQEAAVAAILANGHDIDEVCERLCIRRTTVRSHLKTLMHKLNVRRQSELVSLLARTCLKVRA